MNVTQGARRRYMWELSLSMLAYAVVLLASIAVLRRGAAGSWSTAVALTPVVPVVAVFASSIRYMLRIDELQRQIHMEALALAAGITALLAVTYGFLEVAGFPKISAWYVYLCVMIAWIASVPLVARRYK